jgi:hypothetical protein
VQDEPQTADEPLHRYGLHAGVPADPAASSVQVPGVAAHVSQLPPHAELQQNPSMQLFVVHSRQPDTLQSVVRLHAMP